MNTYALKKTALTSAIIVFAVMAITGCASTAPSSTPQTKPDYGWTPIEKDADGDYMTEMHSWEDEAVHKLGFYAVTENQCELGMKYSYGSYTDLKDSEDTIKGTVDMQVGGGAIWSVDTDLYATIADGFFLLRGYWKPADKMLVEMFEERNIDLVIEWPNGESTPVYEFVADNAQVQLNNLLTMCHAGNQQVSY